LIKAADMMIARRADTRARADFATWTMMAKLNGASSLPPAAQAFLDQYKELLKQKSETEASEAIIQLIYQSYYGEMGGAGLAPEVRPRLAKQLKPGATSPPSNARPRDVRRRPVGRRPSQNFPSR